MRQPSLPSPVSRASTHASTSDRSAGEAHATHLMAPCGDSQNQRERQCSKRGKAQSSRCSDGLWTWHVEQTSAPHRRRGIGGRLVIGQRLCSGLTSAARISALNRRIRARSASVSFEAGSTISPSGSSRMPRRLKSTISASTFMTKTVPCRASHRGGRAAQNLGFASTCSQRPRSRHCSLLLCIHCRHMGIAALLSPSLGASGQGFHYS